ncbi:MAG: hypothetical protein K5Q68_07185 [Roseococcus sp.]|nr:hypothetical protein [Roseococcus sp.]
MSMSSKRSPLMQAATVGPSQAATPFAAPEYDHDLLRPIAYDLDISRDYMRRAGYEY